MLYGITGGDTAAARSHIATLCQGLGDPLLVQIEADDFSEERLAEVTASQGLFGQVLVGVVRGCIAEGGAEAYLLAHCEDLAASLNHIIVWEESFSKKVEKKMTPYLSDSWECIAPKASTSSHISSPFALADALGRRDKKRAWILLVQALDDDQTPEQIYGTLLWQVKALALVAEATERGDTSSALGLKPFVANKARQFARNYTLAEIHALLASFVEAYHDARRGGTPLALGLERILLQL